MKKILLLALLFASTFANGQEDYEFLLMSSPELKQEYPQDNRTLSDGGVYHSFVMMGLMPSFIVRNIVDSISFL